MDQVIAFATLLFGLVVGPQEVELLVGGEVTRVSVRLDGEGCPVSERSLWTVTCDFGSMPEPRLLVAEAFDEADVRVGSVERWVNVPRAAAEVSLVVDTSAGPERTTARLSWQSLSSDEPLRSLVTLDGESLEVDDLRELVLPPYDPGSAHLLRAELEFPDDLTAQAELVFGGFFMDSVQAELDAHLVHYDGKSSPDPADVRVGSRVDGSVVRTVAIEKGPADLLIVRSREARENVRELLARESRSMRSSNKSLSNLSTEGRLKALVPLPEDTRARFLWPYELEAERDAYRLFGTSDELTQVDGGLLWLLSQMEHDDDGEQTLADAVAVAGMNALRGNRRRAVLLVLSGTDADAGTLNAAQARHYLRSIDVPLFVWTVGEGAPAPGAWGAGEDVTSVSRMRKAGRSLARELARQRLVWVEGGLRSRELEIVGPSLERLPARYPTR